LEAQDGPSGKLQGKTGEKQHVVLGKGYPYVILSPEDSGFEPEDTFTLESNDGSYSKTVKFSHAEIYEGYCVVWFRLPPKSPLYSLKVTLAPRQLPNGEVLEMEYYLFEDEVLTYRNEEEPPSEENLSLR
jgi:hypothetical protein